MVATFNADPFYIENDEVLDDVINAMDTYSYLYVRGNEHFEEFCQLLDGNANTYSMIFVSNGVYVGVLI